MFQLWETFEGSLPDFLFLPLGEGATLLGIWKGLQELKQLGWLQEPFPMVIAVQSTRSSAVGENMSLTIPPKSEYGDSIAAELTSAQLIEPELITAIIRGENWGVSVCDDDTMLKIQKQIARSEGILLSPEGCATIAAYLSLKNKISKNNGHTIVFINPVNGSKYMQSIGFLRN